MSSNISTPSYSRLRKNAGVFKVGTRDLDDLIGAFEESFKEDDMENLARVWERECLRISCSYESGGGQLVCDDVNTMMSIYSMCTSTSEKWTDCKQRLMPTLHN